MTPPEPAHPVMREHDVTTMGLRLGVARKRPPQPDAAICYNKMKTNRLEAARKKGGGKQGTRGRANAQGRRCEDKGPNGARWDRTEGRGCKVERIGGGTRAEKRGRAKMEGRT